MGMIDPMLAEFAQEMATTRKMLEILPEKHLGWKPHPKSLSLGRLASHIAEMPAFASKALSTEVFDIDPASGKPLSYKPLDLKTVKEILEAFDKNVADASAAMKTAKDDQLLKTWTLQAHGKTVFTMPRIAVLRVMVFSHVFHHRGQLSVYLRLKDVPLPSVYGPTADSKGM